MLGPARRVAPILAVLCAVVCSEAISGCGTNSSTSTSPRTSQMPGMAMSPDSPSGTQRADMTSMIMIDHFAFTAPASVKAGSTVMVMNQDGETHTVTGEGGSFDVSVPAGATRTFTAPAMPGAYPFHCSFHTNMNATLVVR